MILTECARSAAVSVKRSHLHNLQNLTVKIPKNVLTVVSGVAGSGKSSLICGELLKQHPEACQGTKYNEEVLRYRLNGLNILDVLNLTVDEAAAFFPEPKIRNKLKTLQHVGMGYITLGQPTNTLSGGECQRVKLASHLKSKNAVYAMDEPTTGLHGADVDVLMKLLNQLVDNGNTVIVVEHDPDVIRQSDWVIDIGPQAGKNGGQIIFEGTPEDLIQCRTSATAAYLRREFSDSLLAI